MYYQDYHYDMKYRLNTMSTIFVEKVTVLGKVVAIYEIIFQHQEVIPVLVIATIYWNDMRNNELNIRNHVLIIQTIFKV